MGSRPGKFPKTQAQYQSHLAKLQKIGIDSTKKANAAIMGQHKIFVEQMNEIQKEANAKVKQEVNR